MAKEAPQNEQKPHKKKKKVRQGYQKT